MPEKDPDKAKLAARIRRVMQEALKTLEPPSNMPPMLAAFLAGAAKNHSTFTHTLIRHFADQLAEDLINDIKD